MKLQKLILSLLLTGCAMEVGEESPEVDVVTQAAIYCNARDAMQLDLDRRFGSGACGWTRYLPAQGVDEYTCFGGSVQLDVISTNKNFLGWTVRIEAQIWNVRNKPGIGFVETPVGKEVCTCSINGSSACKVVANNG